MIWLLLIFSAVSGFSLSWYRYHTAQPVADDDSDIITVHYPASWAKEMEGHADAGKQVFNQFCSTCHGQKPVINLHAPRLGDKKRWQGIKKIGIDQLLQMTIQGHGAMPARGGCFECSDDELKAAILYMMGH